MNKALVIILFISIFANVVTNIYFSSLSEGVSDLQRSMSEKKQVDKKCASNIKQVTSKLGAEFNSIKESNLLFESLVVDSKLIAKKMNRSVLRQNRQLRRQSDLIRLQKDMIDKYTEKNAMMYNVFNNNVDLFSKKISPQINDMFREVEELDVQIQNIEAIIKKLR